MYGTTIYSIVGVSPSSHFSLGVKRNLGCGPGEIILRHGGSGVYGPTLNT